tara:strand:+ start:207 stop:647 length:441 start_codon:yes stop_codon:yes gene_type:complete
MITPNSLFFNYQKSVKVVKILKDNFPNEVFTLKENSINIQSKTNSRLCKGSNNGISDRAHYHNSKPPRICLKQKWLKYPYGYSSWLRYNSTTNKYGKYNGTLSIIDLMCHETAHHRTTGHRKGFKIKYSRFFKFMINKLISGEYYQ